MSPTSGKLSAKNPTILRRIDARLVTYYTSRGFTGVTAICTGRSPTTASCKVTGTDSSGVANSTVVTVAVNPTTGLLRATQVAP